MTNTFKNEKLLERQIVLPFLKSLEIAIKSIRVRFFRSMVVTISLILAISFFSFVLIDHHILKKILQTQELILIEKASKYGYEIDEAGRVLINPTQRWVLFLSLLVCVVGIVNAQIMSVSERFREIGTMKCLGALDHFILRLFLIEAAIIGIIGSSFGAFIGIFFSLINSTIRYGWNILYITSLLNVLLILFYSTAVGTTLSLIGVFYPARMASKMQPVEAMRAQH